MVKECLVIYSDVMLIMFIHLDFDPDRMVSIFNEKLSEIKRPEIKKLVWMSKSEFFLSIEGNTDLLDNKINYIEETGISNNIPILKENNLDELITNNISTDSLNNLKNIKELEKKEMYGKVQILLESAIICYGDFTCIL